MKPVLLIQCRMGSTRLPGKVVMEMAGKPMLEGMLSRLKGFPVPIAVITPTDKEQWPIWGVCDRVGVACWLSVCEENDLVSRHIGVANSMDADTIIRIPGDNPLVWAPAVDQLIYAYKQAPVIYGSNIYDFPIDGEYVTGLGAEIAPVQAYEWVNSLFAHGTPEREHPHKFFVDSGYYDYKEPTVNLGVDTQEDFDRINAIVSKVGWDAPPNVLVQAYREVVNARAV